MLGFFLSKDACNYLEIFKVNFIRLIYETETYCSEVSVEESMKYLYVTGYKATCPYIYPIDYLRVVSMWTNHINIFQCLMAYNFNRILFN